MTRRRRRQGDHFAPQVELPITAMLDMFFQILFFFVMTYRPSALEVQFLITLSAGEQGGPQDTKVETPPSTEISKTPAPVTVVAKATENGALESLDVTTFAGEKDTISERGGGARGQGTGIVDESTNRMLQGLERKLRQIRAQQEEIAKRGGVLDDRLLLRASGALRWEETMRILDTCRRRDGKDLFPKIELDILR
jgi:biopolymer transport protein ExbD